MTNEQLTAAWIEARDAYNSVPEDRQSLTDFMQRMARVITILQSRGVLTDSEALPAGEIRPLRFVFGDRSH